MFYTSTVVGQGCIILLFYATQTHLIRFELFNYVQKRQNFYYRSNEYLCDIGIGCTQGFLGSARNTEFRKRV